MSGFFAKAFYFNPRAPRGARLTLLPRISILILISIHVPREGHDYVHQHALLNNRPFQSTCPARGTTQQRQKQSAPKHISIHVPREGHDLVVRLSFNCLQRISIHVPREGHDQAALAKAQGEVLFQSTCPARGTTLSLICVQVPKPFQSTCPARGTTGDIYNGYGEVEFQSTCPARGTTVRTSLNASSAAISIHVPREGHDYTDTNAKGNEVISIHVPREGHDYTYNRTVKHH